MNTKHKPPKLFEWILRKITKDHQCDSVLGDYSEDYSYFEKTQGVRAAKKWYRKEVLNSLLPFIINNLISGGNMFWNYLKIAFRNFKRQKVYTAINISGLTLGIVSSIVILLFIYGQSNYDNYHIDKEQIYRITSRSISQDHDFIYAQIGAKEVSYLKDGFPQIESIARILPVGSRLMTFNNIKFYEENRFFADNDLFSILSIPFIKGNKETALSKPYQIVITKKIAEKYFGDENPIGKNIKFDNTDYLVTGVVKNQPKNSQFQFNILLSMETIKDRYPFDIWFLTNFYTFVKIVPGSNITDLERGFTKLINEEAEQLLSVGGERIIYKFQNISDLHFNSDVRNELGYCVSKKTLYIFGAVSIFILLIACINYINLSTSRSIKRSKEIGLRKVLGAKKNQLVNQFLGESFLITLMSFLCSLIIIYLVIQIINTRLNVNLNFENLFNILPLALLFGILIFSSMLGGLLPAFIISSYSPIKSLKEIIFNNKNSDYLRKALVVLQYSLSTIQIVGTIIIYLQITFMINKDLGFDKDDKIIVPFEGINVRSNFQEIRNEFNRIPEVTSSSFSSNILGFNFDNWDTILHGETEKQIAINHLYVDENFINNYGIKLFEGRNLRVLNSKDTVGKFLINTAAANAYGFENPMDMLGKELESAKRGRVIGIVENFHHKGVQKVIEPLLLEFNQGRFRNLTLKTQTGNYSSVIKKVENKWKQLFPDKPFRYFFLDERFNTLYKLEEQFAFLFTIFTIIGICIATLGLIGLSSYTVEQNKKEIAIRKVLGASSKSVIFNLSKRFVLLVLIANFVAFPFIYILSNNWLNDFAYKIEIDPLVYILTGLFTILLAFLTVSFQSIKAALANPVDSLKYE